jgi:hypothetical protein
LQTEDRAARRTPLDVEVSAAAAVAWIGGWRVGGLAERLMTARPVV